MGKEDLAKNMVEMIYMNREVQKAILDFVCSCPNVKTEI